jgi:hypothetical protein
MKGKFVGEALETLQDKEELFGDYIAETLGVSNSMYSAMKNNKRPMSFLVGKKAISEYGDTSPKAAMMLTRIFTDGQTPPVIDGDALDIDNHLAMIAKTKEEIMDIQDAIVIKDLLRDPLKATDREKESVWRLVLELMEADIWVENLAATLIEKYQFSRKEAIDAVIRKMKSEGTLV